MINEPVVFVIDDDIDDQEIFGIALDRASKNANCVFANDGIHAIEKIKNDESFIPDFIFLDMNMPRMDGSECLTELRKIPRLNHIPVYLYSTSLDAVGIDKSKSLGATDYIMKPSSIFELTDILKNIIKTKVFTALMIFFSISMIPQISSGQTDSISEINALKKLSVTELMNLTVTSVSRTPEKLTDVASAVQVLTRKDIIRSTASRLPGALRLVSNLQVAQGGSHDWGISSRGFNGAPIASSTLADKLLVMIDGRTVYTPLFGGVYWDVQNVLLEDLDRIEVISGPGGTLWGANAVNGVVNVISKDAKETQGIFASVASGTFAPGQAAVRYGSHVDSSVFFRVYGQRFVVGSSKFIDGTSARDEWHLSQGGFRMDANLSKRNHLTVQGDVYGGEEGDTLTSNMNGQNVLARFGHTISNTADISVQMYFDRAYRYFGSSRTSYVVNTADLEAQHRFVLKNKHRMLWGIGYRMLVDNIKAPNPTFTPASRTLDQINFYLQDRISIIDEKFDVTLGSKFLYNYYTGVELQPTIRFAWQFVTDNTLWAAVSRAVRTPSRFDTDVTSFTRVEHEKYVSEKVVANEIGYRFRPIQPMSISISTYLNYYTDLRTLDSTGSQLAPFVFGNNMNATTWGAELSATYIATNWWKIKVGYTYLNKKFEKTSPLVLQNHELIEGIDPANQFLIHSIMDLPKNFQLDLIGRYVDALPAESVTGLPTTPAYFELNARVAWEYKNLTISVNGNSLLSDHHTEFGRVLVKRSVTGKVMIRF